MIRDEESYRVEENRKPKPEEQGLCPHVRLPNLLEYLHTSDHRPSVESPRVSGQE
jgi:hypothetical protein